MADSDNQPGPSMEKRTESTTSNSTTTKPTNNGASTSSAASATSPPPVNMTEYCKSLETWLGNVYMQRNCAMSAYFTAYSLVFGNNSHVYSAFSSGGATTRAATGAFQNGGNRVNLDANQNPVFEFVHQGFRVETLQIAPVWKRLMAEAFDFILLLLVKIFVTISLIDNFELIDLDNLELEALQDSNNIYEIAISLTWELIVLEITHRIIVCFFEAYCLSKSGYTPGKNLFGLRVIQCQTIQEINNRIVISPGTNLTFGRALLRSVLKNFSIALFFPMCFTLLHFENNQTLYDHFSKSIVVSY